MVNRITEIQLPALNISSTYDGLDFQVLYEREYNVHQETKRHLQIAFDKIEYLEKKLKEALAHNRFLAKLLFSAKTEKAKKKARKLQ